MTYEEKYINARGKYLTACSSYIVYPCASNLTDYKIAEAELSTLCTEILEILMKENSDVLQRLKMI